MSGIGLRRGILGRLRIVGYNNGIMAKDGTNRGRPTKYTPDLVDKVYEYLDTCKQTVEDYVKTDGEKSQSYQRIIHANIPKRTGLAGYLKVNQETLTEWGKIYPDFSAALDEVDRQQHDRLVEGGLNGDFSPVITKLMLSNNHGYREKSEVDNNVKINEVFDENQLNNIFKRRGQGSATGSEG